MTRRVSAVLAAVLMLVPLLVVAPAAQAARTCAIRSDYNAVRSGMTRTQVTRILHNPGRRIAGAWAAVNVWRYPVCTRRTGYILVTYFYGKVRLKRAVW